MVPVCIKHRGLGSSKFSWLRQADQWAISMALDGHFRLLTTKMTKAKFGGLVWWGRVVSDVVDSRVASAGYGEIRGSGCSLLDLLVNMVEFTFDFWNFRIDRLENVVLDMSILCLPIPIECCSGQEHSLFANSRHYINSWGFFFFGWY